MLNGKKVVLRAIRRDDLPRLWQFNNDVEVELLGGGDPPYPQSLERLYAEFDQQAGEGGRNGASFTIDDGGKCIGQCALYNFNDVNQTCEIGITIGDRDYWGQGYGRDAIRVLVDYAFRLRNIRKVWLRVNGNNERAIRAYQSVGFQEEGRQRAHVWHNNGYIDLVYMGLLRDEWQADKD